MPAKKDAPKILLIHDDLDEVIGVSKSLSEYFDKFKCIHHKDSDLTGLLTHSPPIILIGFPTTEESIEYYTEALQDKAFRFPHYSVLLCGNKQAKEAFSLCIKGLFDDFIIFKPLYESYSVCFSVFRGLETELTEAREKYRTLFIETQEQTLDKCLEKAIVLRQKCIDTFKNERTLAERQQAEGTSTAQNEHIQSIERIEAEVIPGLNDLIGVLQSEQAESTATNANEAEKTASPSGTPKPSAGPEKEQVPAQVAMPKDLYPPEPANQQNAPISSSPKNLYPQDTAKQPTATSVGSPNDLYPKSPDVTIQPTPATPQSNVPAKQDEASTPPPSPETKENTADESETKESAAKEFEGYNILIAEDNNTYRNILNRSLNRLGFSVHEAENGREAMEMVQTMRFDVAILDLFMPELNGIEATQKIRTMSHAKDLKIIALTGNKDKAIAREWVRSGLNDYLLKPVNAEKLYLKLKKHLG